MPREKFPCWSGDGEKYGETPAPLRSLSCSPNWQNGKQEISATKFSPFVFEAHQPGKRRSRSVASDRGDRDAAAATTAAAICCFMWPHNTAYRGSMWRLTARRYESKRINAICAGASSSSSSSSSAALSSSWSLVHSPSVAVEFGSGQQPQSGMGASRKTTIFVGNVLFGERLIKTESKILVFHHVFIFFGRNCALRWNGFSCLDGCSRSFLSQIDFAYRNEQP